MLGAGRCFYFIDCLQVIEVYAWKHIKMSIEYL